MSIASEITRLQTAKSDLKTAIEDKGVTVPTAATLDDYADLVDAIQTGGGNIGGLANMVDVNTQDYQWAYMLMCMKNGDTVGGTVTYTTAFPNTEQLLLSTGLTTLHGFMFVGTDQDLRSNTGLTQSNKFVICHVNSSDSYNMVGLSGNVTGSGTTYYMLGWNQESNRDGAPLNGTMRIDGGDIYFKARYNRNAGYQIVGINNQYEWLAW